jgi:hypothetical protein
MAFMLGPYHPLLWLAVEHAYRTDTERCRLRFQPTAACQRLLAASTCVLHNRPDGLALFVDAGAAPLAADAAFDVEMSSADPLFNNYTAGLDAPPGCILHFDSADALLDAQRGTWRLQAAKHSQRESLLPRLRITLRPLAPVGDGAAPTRLLLALPSRATYWKYLLLGDWSGEAPEIVDAAQQVGFESAVPEPLADGSIALAIRSSEPLPLQARPDRRFQLRSRRSARTSSRVLIKRLPSASPRGFGRIHIAGVPALVSEIYVPR